MHEMTRIEKVVNLGAVVVPFAASIAAIVLLWNSLVSGTDLAILAGMYLATALGITVGFHRLLTHRSFQTPKWLEYLFAVLGSMAVQGPVNSWVADHRKHHAHTDKEGDPHSPHVGHGDGVRGVLAGLWHAHTGWLLSEQGRAEWKRYARDLDEDRGMRFISRHFVWLVVLSLAVPAGLGFALTGTAAGALTAFLWGGLVRIFLVHHVTWSVNSVCHFLGSRRFAVEDESRNVFWLALPSLGEAWHHNHHAFPRSARHGLKRWELDPSAWVIAGLDRIGLARNVVRISSERQLEKRSHRTAEPPGGSSIPGGAQESGRTCARATRPA
jgi:stearoyl-CoA desaturase (delta-9 desaturase)